MACIIRVSASLCGKIYGAMFNSARQYARASVIQSKEKRHLLGFTFLALPANSLDVSFDELQRQSEFW